MLNGCGIEAEILFVRNEQKDCSEKPELLMNSAVQPTAQNIFFSFKSSLIFFNSQFTNRFFLEFFILGYL